MKWTIRIEFRPDGHEPIHQTIGAISRPLSDLLPEQVGLTLEEGRQLIRSIELAVIGNQVHAYTLSRRICGTCGEKQQFKDIRTKCVQTVFGAYRLRSRRLRTCECETLRSGAHPCFPPANYSSSHDA